MERHRLSFLGFLTAAVALAAWPRLATAQENERQLKNLQHFPKDISRPELVGRMRQFSFALGVACTHCHGTEEQTGFDLSGVDFSLDIKPTKHKAREMLKMVEAINGTLLAGLRQRSPLNLTVDCATCHSGIPLPEPIEQRFLRKVSEEGGAAAIEDYRKLRERYYGAAAYNFGEQPLVEVAFQLHRDQDYHSALAVSELNLDFHPQSGQSLFRLAEAHLELGEKEKARAAYQKLLQMHPDDRRSKKPPGSP